MKLEFDDNKILVLKSLFVFDHDVVMRQLKIYVASLASALLSTAT